MYLMPEDGLQDRNM